MLVTFFPRSQSGIGFAAEWDGPPKLTQDLYIFFPLSRLLGIAFAPFVVGLSWSSLVPFCFHSILLCWALFSRLVVSTWLPKPTQDLEV